MTKWFIQKICMATEDNPTFPNAVHEYIFGKNKTIIVSKVTKDYNDYKKWVVEEDHCTDIDFLNNYGYISKKMAEKVLAKHLKHFKDEKFWYAEYKIISVET